MNSRTSILASANPVQSRYNRNLSVTENIELPPTLLSRFDLIYLVLDNVDKESDSKLARHIISLYTENEEEEDKEIIDNKTLSQYIAYARAMINPVISEEASNELVNGYLELRRPGMNKKIISATPRQLESLIRISESFARMRFSSVVTKNDVKEALLLIKEALKISAMDPFTGTIDMDLITTGRSSSTRGLGQAVQHLLENESRDWSFEQIFEVIQKQTEKLTTSTLKYVLKCLEEEGSIVHKYSENRSVYSAN